MLFLFVFHIGYKLRKNAKKGSKISQGSWRIGARTVSVLAAAEEFCAAASLSRCSDYTLDKQGWKSCFLAAVQKQGIDCAECWNLNLKRGKRSILKREMIRADIEERETKKIPISLRILTKIEGKVQDSKLWLGFLQSCVYFLHFLGLSLYLCIFLFCKHKFP